MATSTEQSSKLTREEECKERDQIIESIGDFGRWQLVNIVLVSLVLMPATMPILAITFMNARSDFWCERPSLYRDMSIEQWREMSTPIATQSDGSLLRDNCRMWDSPDFQRPQDNATVTCDKFQHDRSEFTATILQDFDLVCDSAFYENLAQVVFLWGCIFANVGGFISDWLGRRCALFLQVLLVAVTSLVVALVEDVNLFLVMRFFQALGTTSTFSVVNVWSMEVVGGKYKTIVGVLCLFPWMLAWFLLALIVAVTPNWRHAQLITSGMAACALIVAYLMPESPKWLLSAKKVVEAEKVVRQAASVNQRSLPPDFHLVCEPSLGKKEKEETNVLSLIFNWNMLPKMCLLCNSWVSVTFVYYGLTLNSSNLAQDVFLSYILNGMVEVPSYALTLLVLLKGGRKKPFVALYIVAGLTLMATIFVPEGVFANNWPAVALALLGRLCISFIVMVAAFSIVFIYTSEMLPTHLRGSGMALCSLTARFGAMLAPYVGSLDRHFGVMVPIAIFGGSSLITGLLNLMLPETSNRKLPDTLKEAEEARLEFPRCFKKKNLKDNEQDVKC